jgi:hypothetical protein
MSASSTTTTLDQPSAVVGDKASWSSANNFEKDRSRLEVVGEGSQEVLCINDTCRGMSPLNGSQADFLIMSAIIRCSPSRCSMPDNTSDTVGLSSHLLLTFF